MKKFQIVRLLSISNAIFKSRTIIVLSRKVFRVICLWCSSFRCICTQANAHTYVEISRTFRFEHTTLAMWTHEENFCFENCIALIWNSTRVHWFDCNTHCRHLHHELFVHLHSSRERKNKSGKRKLLPQCQNAEQNVAAHLKFCYNHLRLFASVSLIHICHSINEHDVHNQLLYYIILHDTRLQVFMNCNPSENDFKLSTRREKLELQVSK